MASILWIAALAVGPLAALIWFVVSLVLFLSAPKGSESRKKRGIMAIVSAAVMGALIILPIVFIALMYVSVIFYM